MNTEKLITDSEVVNSVVESLEDIPQDSSAKYALWLISRDDTEEPTDEFFIYEFDTPEEAVAKAETVDFKFIEEQIEESVQHYSYKNEISHFSIEVETVVPDPEDIDSTMNIGTIYRRELWLDGEYGDAEAAGLGDYNNVVCVTGKDFEILEDGTLKVSCQLLRDFNKNDTVLFEFVDDAAVLEYKIMSKVIYADGDYYLCELTI